MAKAVKEVVEEVDVENGEPRAQFWKHEAMFNWLVSEKGLNAHAGPVTVLGYAFANRAEWRKTTTYRDLISNHHAEATEADALLKESRATERAAKAAAKAQAKAEADAVKAATEAARPAGTAPEVSEAPKRRGRPPKTATEAPAVAPEPEPVKATRGRKAAAVAPAPAAAPVKATKKAASKASEENPFD